MSDTLPNIEGFVARWHREAETEGGERMPTLREHLACAELEHVQHVASQATGQIEAARLLGVSVRSLQRLLHKHGLRWSTYTR